jgi:hypothetical protein
MVNWLWKHFHGNWSQIPAKTQSPPDLTVGAILASMYILLPQTPPSDLNFNVFFVSRKAQPYNQVQSSLLH